MGCKHNRWFGIRMPKRKIFISKDISWCREEVSKAGKCLWNRCREYRELKGYGSWYMPALCKPSSIIHTLPFQRSNVPDTLSICIIWFYLFLFSSGASILSSHSTRFNRWLQFYLYADARTGSKVDPINVIAVSFAMNGTLLAFVISHRSTVMSRTL